MKLILHVEDRRLVILMALISLAALAAAVALSLGSAMVTNQSLRDTYAEIIGTVSQKYPQAEADVVHDIHASDSSSTALGYQILAKYGQADVGVPENEVATTLLRRSLPISILLFGLVCAGFILLLSHYRLAVLRQIGQLSGYLHRLDAGDYSLDIRDNDEGSFSLLKNDLYKITVRLREQAELLQKDKTALSDWIADVSHQIKTPLTALGVLADLLAEDPPEKDRREFVDRLRLQLGRIQWLVTALLKLARLDAGTVVFKKEPVNILKMIRQAVEPLQIAIEVKKQQLDIQGDEGAVYSGDFNWSAEALTNIVKDSIEHTPEGGQIVISFNINALFSEITVKDNGEGIASQDLPNLFTRFYRARNAGENSVGIGLALAKAIFQGQGGDISVKSDERTGTSFTIRVFQGVV